MHHINEWDDYLRITIIALNVGCLFILMHRLRQQRANWSAKTRDYWFALVMWSLAALTASFEGLLQDLPPGVRLVLVAAATLVTLKALCRRGSWGGTS